MQLCNINPYKNCSMIVTRELHIELWTRIEGMCKNCTDESTAWCGIPHLSTFSIRMYAELVGLRINRDRLTKINVAMIQISVFSTCCIISIDGPRKIKPICKW